MNILLILLVLMLAGCASTSENDAPLNKVASKVSVAKQDNSVPLSASAQAKLTKSLTRKFDKDSLDKDEIVASTRIKAISIDAYSWGIQEGMYYRTGVIQNILEKHSGTIHKLISLGKFIVDGKMLMPTVVESERIYVKNSDVSATEINMSYTLDKMPRIVSQVPTWRDYLKRSVAEPEKPLEYALPRTEDEQEAWDREFKRGWASGNKQADAIYNNDLARMHSDIAGLYRYRYLLSQNIVVLPVISKQKTGVILLDSGKTIYLNNVEHRIEMDSIFNDVDNWKPVFYQGDAHE
jgi:defect-in-organelle-trafficking protein DotC